MSKGNTVIGSRLRALRLSRGHGPEEFAEKLGLTRLKLAHIESGRVDMTASHLVTAASILGVTSAHITGEIKMEGAND